MIIFLRAGPAFQSCGPPIFVFKPMTHNTFRTRRGLVVGVDDEKEQKKRTEKRATTRSKGKSGRPTMKRAMGRNNIQHNKNDNGNSCDAPTPIISNRQASAPRFSSLDGPILQVEYYKEPVVMVGAMGVLSAAGQHNHYHALGGAAVQAGLQVSHVLGKSLARMIARKISSTTNSRRRNNVRDDPLGTGTTSRQQNFARTPDRGGTGRRRSADNNAEALPPVPVVGIANYGQTCFANAILQALAASTTMYDYTAQMRHYSVTANELYIVLRQLRCVDAAGGGDTDDTDAPAADGRTPSPVQQQQQQQQARRRRNSVDPRPLLRKFYPSTHEQNDAQEFLQRVIDSIVDQVDWTDYAHRREQRAATTTMMTTAAAAGRERQNRTLMGAMVSKGMIEQEDNDGEDDDRSWESISSCQIAVQLKSFRRLKEGTNSDMSGFNGKPTPLNDGGQVVKEDLTITLDAKIVNGLHPKHDTQQVECSNNIGGLVNGDAAEHHNAMLFNESKKEEEEETDHSVGDVYDDDAYDDDDRLHFNFSKDTVISAESVWIHSYSYSNGGEEKKDDLHAAATTTTTAPHLPTGLELLKQRTFQIDTNATTAAATTAAMNRQTVKAATTKSTTTPATAAAEYSALSPSPLHGWMGTLLSYDACPLQDRPITNALCCTIPVLPKYPHLVDCVLAVLASERIERVQCDDSVRDPALVLERQDWINAIRHASGDTSALQAELDRVEEALQVPLYSDATKTSIFMRLPAILSLHIQRRQPDGRKNTQHVSFDELFVINGTRYRLIAVIEHMGGPNAGHYVCYRPRWWRISDRNVRQVDWNHVRSAQAYMLFYERIDNSNSSG